MILKKLYKSILIIACIFTVFSSNLTGQEEKKGNFKHSFTTFHLEARAELDYLGSYTMKPAFDGFNTQYYYHWDDNHYGFHGKYFNFLLGGNIGDHISYFIRQRIIPKPGTVNLFDNTDFLYLQYRFNKNWSLRVGKEALYIGGFEYDAPPIDVYFQTNFWSQIYCFHVGVSGTYTDNSGKNKLTFQFANSPYIYYTGEGNEWTKGLFSYNLFWNGNFDWFSTLYSVNLVEYECGKFINYISLGNKFTFNKWQFYIDYMNRAVSFDKFFNDFTVVGRLDWKVCNSVNLFAKAGYDQNFAEDRLVLHGKDMMMTPGAQYYFYGLGVEIRPLKYQDLRIHAFVANNTLRYPEYISPVDIYAPLMKFSTLNVNVGATWRINFLNFLPDKLK